MNIETIAAHAGHYDDPGTGAVTMPIHQSTTFERDADGSFPHGYIYSRGGNPNRDALERCLYQLEGGVAAAAFSSGSAATAAVFQSLSMGDHVIAPIDCYTGTAAMLREVFERWGLLVSFVDFTDPPAVRDAAKGNTKLIWAETPSNPLLKITDLHLISEIAREIGALFVCDNTWATPVLQRPLDFGADLVVHATTKYLGGHSDVMGGAVIAKNEGGTFERIRNIQNRYGAVPSPFDCWLTLRGIRTLHLRVRAHSDNAMKIAEFLTQHPRVTAVHYPGLNEHPDHEIAARQMAQFGGMISLQVDGSREDAMKVAAKVKIFTRATSLGGTESLIEHRASIEGPGTQTPENLLRVSVGLENPDDLVADLAQALSDD